MRNETLDFRKKSSSSAIINPDGTKRSLTSDILNRITSVTDELRVGTGSRYGVKSFSLTHQIVKDKDLTPQLAPFGKVIDGDLTENQYTFTGRQLDPERMNFGDVVTYVAFRNVWLWEKIAGTNKNSYTEQIVEREGGY